MNFFKSILADDPDSSEAEADHESGANFSAETQDDGGKSNDIGNGWTFGDLIKTLAVQSESVIEIYRKDLKEFGLGLRKETEIFRETAGRAVKDLPASLEATASVAHGALDGVLKSTAEIISKETLIFTPDRDPETPETNRSFNLGRYSWFDAQLSAIQSDLNTFCEEPEKVEEYGKWKLGFELKDYEDEIDDLVGDNGALENAYKRMVPNEVAPETFWCRYFYRVDKFKQQERVRANLVRRAMSAADDDELTWDVDDEEEVYGVEHDGSSKATGVDEVVENVANEGNVERQEDLNSGSQDVKEGASDSVNNAEKSVMVESGKEGSLDVPWGEKGVEESDEAAVEGEREGKFEVDADGKREEKAMSQISVEVVKGESGKSNPAEDMGWDEIGDTGSGDDQKIETITHDGSANRADLHKRLSVAEDDEGLSWDIEDDDEPVKA